MHANNFDDQLVKSLVDAGASFTVTADVEMQMGFGDPLTGCIRRLGALMTIRSDVEPATSGDMFSAMRLTMNVQRNIDNLNALSRNGSLPETSSISCSEALQWITINAARMIKKENVTGTIEPGKKADIIIIRGEDLNLFPINNAVNAVVRYANP